MLRYRLLLASLAVACHGALAQTTTPPPAVTVQNIAPQLVAFTGSFGNFQNLVNGLAQGAPVQMSTVLPDGSVQLVSFTPTAPLSPVQIAQTLEAARQQLIGLGIATPTAQQLAVALTGGTVPTALGGAQVNGALNPQSTPSPAAQVQANIGAGAGATAAAASPAVSVQTIPAATPPGTLPGAVATPGVSASTVIGTSNSLGVANSLGTTPLAAPRFNTSDSPVPSGSTSRSVVPSGPLTAPGAGSAPQPTREAARATIQSGIPARR
jgi:hypothetical protein